jgi:hypothetical protein
VTASASAQDGGYVLALGGPLLLRPGTPQVPLAGSVSSPFGGFGAPLTLAHGLSAPLAVSPGGTAIAVAGPRSPLDYFSVRRARRTGRARRRRRARHKVPGGVAVPRLGHAGRSLPPGGSGGLRGEVHVIDEPGESADFIFYGV